MSSGYDFKTRKVIIAQVKTGEPKAWGNANKGGTMYNCGVRIVDKWYNQTFFDKSNVDTLEMIEQGNRIFLTLFKEEYKGNIYDKFRFPTEVELQMVKIATFMKVVFEQFPEVKQKYETELE